MPGFVALDQVFVLQADGTMMIRKFGRSV